MILPIPIPLSIPIPIFVASSSSVHVVPFYSQFKDIHSLPWQNVGCGIASLAMIIDYYSEDTISVDALLKDGIEAGAYNKKNGWIHEGLITLSKEYGLIGRSYDLKSLGKDESFEKLKSYLAAGPIMASVYYKFDPKSKIPHLVVIDGVKEGYVYYNDPAAKSGQKKITIENFEKGWKKRLIVIRPEIEKGKAKLV